VVVVIYLVYRSNYAVRSLIIAGAATPVFAAIR
jgi:hypothetical protein